LVAFRPRHTADGAELFRIVVPLVDQVRLVEDLLSLPAHY
jgi:hypothetical protein